MNLGRGESKRACFTKAKQIVCMSFMMTAEYKSESFVGPGGRLLTCTHKIQQHSRHGRHNNIHVCLSNLQLSLLT